MIVLDSSLALSWLFEDESTPAALAVLDRVRDDGAIVPSLWRLEVANALNVAIRRNRIDAAYRNASLDDLHALPISVDTDGDACAWTFTLRLADEFGLTLYDAAYLELAQRRRVPLASLDDTLRAAARALGTATLGHPADASTN